MQCQDIMLICNKPCNTCLELDCPWKGRRADEEERLGHFKEFETVAELIKDLHNDSPGKS